MNVNYIKHLESAAIRIGEDSRLNASHVSMYLALFLIWNHHRFQTPLSINRSEVMKISKIGSGATYHKCMTDLHQWGYLKYEPSHNPLKGSLIYLFNFDTSTEQVLEQLPEQLVEQVLYTSINNTKQNKLTNSKNFSVPPIEEIKDFFHSNKSEIKEADKFFNYYEANGWLVGGKSKMRNWKAAAKNWMANSSKFQNPSEKRTYLHVEQNKDYSVPL
jgi:hypothetical protein